MELERCGDDRQPAGGGDAGDLAGPLPELPGVLEDVEAQDRARPTVGEREGLQPLDAVDARPGLHVAADVRASGEHRPQVPHRIFLHEERADFQDG
ncbi:MAG: hypothetical protein NT049_04420, partial [Planctomycetota bacterium]|nr:hypothetical protein [Planctomycetota bacterium]